MHTLSSLIADYLEVGEYEKQLSPDTIKAYRIDLRQFLEFVGGAWPDKEILNQYIKHINQTFAPRSVKRKLASVRAFYYEMELCGKLEENPFDKLHIRIQSPKQLPHIIPEQVVQALLQSAYESYMRNFAGYRGSGTSIQYWPSGLRIMFVDKRNVLVKR
jgi:integrase/recombinase XerD